MVQTHSFDSFPESEPASIRENEEVAYLNRIGLLNQSPYFFFRVVPLGERPGQASNPSGSALPTHVKVHPAAPPSYRFSQPAEDPELENS